MKIIWSPLSVERITEIAQYIANDNPKAANNWIEQIFSSVEQLETFPKSGKIVTDLNNDAVRELIYENYRIIYMIESKQISILTVRNVRQILPESDFK
ncbi:MAG: type II toxin-antitoxin system RelE/ParE family toxin [Fidelibacterota bacterium]